MLNNNKTALKKTAKYVIIYKADNAEKYIRRYFYESWYRYKNKGHT